ncbi:MAG: hypothetical protein ACNS63_03260 [Candidatus Nitrospinota bacterium M3_3B_026]
MENLVWIAAGLALIAMIATRLREQRQESRHRRGLSPAASNRFRGGHDGMFDARVIALEFDESGPVMFINGKFKNGEEPTDIGLVTAEVEHAAGTETFFPFDADTGEEPGERRLGDLVNLVAPASFSPFERGMFRAPLFSPDREERLASAVDRLDSAAMRMVEKLDREFDSYSLEGEPLARLEEDFRRDFVVKEIADEIERELLWRPGRFSIIAKFVSGGNDVVDKISLTIHLDQSNAEKLRKNVDAIITNALRAELDLEPALYTPVIFERE